MTLNVILLFPIKAVMLFNKRVVSVKSVVYFVLHLHGDDSAT
jgi:hypothetical protein